MQAGKLRHRVQVQTYSETQDTYGEPDRTWTTATTVWASIEPLSGQELLAAQQLAAEASHRVIVRYNSSIAPTSRLKFGTRVFDIVSALNWQERGATMELFCKEVL